MRIRKNGKVINLTESDLRRITKRVISESEQEDDLDGLTPCKESDLEKIVDSLKDMDKKDKIRIEVSSKRGDVLKIDFPGGNCGCTKDDFFAKVYVPLI